MICGPLFLKIISIGRDHLSAIALKTELNSYNSFKIKLELELTQDLSLNFCKNKHWTADC